MPWIERWCRVCVVRFRRYQSYTDHSLGRGNLLGFESGELAVAIMNCRKSRRVCSDMDHFAKSPVPPEGYVWFGHEIPGSSPMRWHFGC